MKFTLDKSFNLKIYVGNSNKRKSNFEIFTYNPEYEELILEEIVNCENDVKLIEIINNKLIFTGHHDGGARLWDLKTLECKGCLIGHKEQVSGCCVYQEDKGKIVTCGYDQSINFYDISEFE